MPDIIDTSDIAQGQAEDGVREWDEKLQTSAVASGEEKPGGISFYVQMRDWTVNDMEELIVEAAARMIVGRSGDSKLSKLIEDRALAMITERADEKLDAVANNVLATTLTPKGYDQKNPITIGESIGMLGRDYLDQTVRLDGSLPRDSYEAREGIKRMEYIVRRHISQKFEAELQQATNAAVAEIRGEIKARHEQALSTEKARIAEALAKL